MTCKTCKQEIHYLGDGVFSHTQPEGNQEVQIAWANKKRALPCWMKAEPVWMRGYCDDVSCTGEDRQYVTDVEMRDGTHWRCEAHIPTAEEMPESVEYQGVTA